MYKGYKLIKEEWLDEYKSKARLFEHEKTGARVLKLENDDDNKVFSIGFKTVREDSTGICHILEHSVLSGSRKYKTKEPFMDLIKNSLQTFLNAMTFNDKTIYPISSRNEKDFFNLCDVYLDAVFFPALHENDKIFKQEGWHYEIENADDDIKINGVVYNEMKGAMSSDISQVYELIGKYLYPNSSYCYNSGGDPADIPDLTLDELRAYHKSHYNPTNSYVFYWGNGDTEKELAHLDEYLSQFDRVELVDDMKDIQPLEKSFEKELYYYGEEKAKNDFVTVSFVCGDGKNPVDKLVHDLIESAMISEDGANIKDRLIQEGLTEDVTGIYSIGDKLNFSVIAKKTYAANKDKIVKIVEEELKKLAEDGIEENVLKALIHQQKYDTLNFGDSPHKGIMVYIRATDSWLYGSDPIEGLKFKEAIETIEKNPSLVKDYAKKYLNGDKMVLVIKPDAELNNKREAALKEKMAAYKKSLSNEEIEKLIADTKDLFAFQLSEDSEEAKATIPALDVKDLKAKVEEVPVKIDGNLSFVDTFTNGVLYMDASTSIDDMADGDIEILNIISKLIGKVDTKNYSYKDLNTAINLKAYDFDQSFAASKYYDKESGEFTLVQRISANRGDFADAFDLLKEITFNTDFSKISRVRELLTAEITKKKMAAVMGGVGITLVEALKGFGRAAEIRALLSGTREIKAIEELLAKSDAEIESILNEGYKKYQDIFNSNGLFHITGEEEDFEEIKKVLTAQGLYTDSRDRKEIPVGSGTAKSTAIVAMTDVNYCVDACLYELENGADYVVSRALSNSYLHDNIRAKGGAYGDGINVSANMVYMFSYRDPNLDKTFEVYENAYDWLRTRDFKEEDLNSLIIGAYNMFDPLLTARQKSLTAFGMLLSHKTVDDTNRELGQALKTNNESFKAFADQLEAAMKNKGRAVLTNDKGMEETKIKFEDKIEIK